MTCLDMRPQLHTLALYPAGQVSRYTLSFAPQCGQGNCPSPLAQAGGHRITAPQAWHHTFGLKLPSVSCRSRLFNSLSASDCLRAHATPSPLKKIISFSGRPNCVSVLLAHGGRIFAYLVQRPDKCDKKEPHGTEDAPLSLLGKSGRRLCTASSLLCL